MNDIYTVPELYDAFHGDKSNDIPLIVSKAQAAGTDVLELAAGTGRLAVPLCKAGLNYTGLELSPSYAHWARKKIDALGLTANIIIDDMRTFDLGTRYDFIFIGFNSFLHLLTDEDAMQCLTRVKSHLKPTGQFLLDVFVPNPDYLYRDPEKLYPAMTFTHLQGGHCQIREKTRYNPDTERMAVTWYFYREDDPEPEIYSFEMRMCFPDTIDRLLTDAGFTILEKLGDYDGTPLGPESPLQITIAGR